MKLQRTDFAIAGLLGITYAILLGATSSSVGYVRDEGHYFVAGNAYARWFEALWDDMAVVRLKSGETVRGAHIGGSAGGELTVRTPAGPRVLPAAQIADATIGTHPDRSRVWTRPFVDGIWRENFEHPVLMKSLFVLSYRVFGERLGWLNMGDSYRLPAWLFAGLPEGADRGELLYGRSNVGSFAKSGDALAVSAWRKNGSGRGTCEGTFRAGTLERAGKAAVAAKDLDDAYRTLIEGCFGSRLPR